MPYVCCDGNRYTGEHDCKRYHCGEQTMIRECCLADYRKQRDQAERNAFTRFHPAAQMECSAWNSLTIAEEAIVRSEYGGSWKEK